MECQYVYLERSETINYGQTTMRLSVATIMTNENCWPIFVEQANHDEARDMVGQTEYERLDGEVSERLKGFRRLPGMAAPEEDGMGKEVNIPKGFDLGGIWCKAAGFYKMSIFVPADDYKNDD
jgi:hypothetical protein